MNGSSFKDTAIVLSGLSDRLSVEGVEGTLILTAKEIAASPTILKSASHIESIEISQYVMMTYLAIEVRFDVESFQEKLLEAGEWLHDTNNLAKMENFIDRMADS